MRVVRGIGLCLLLMLFSASFFACDYVEMPQINISGIVILSDEGLGNVALNSNFKNITKTNSNGEFEFSINANTLTITPELSGYFFEPSSITVSESKDNIVFNAIKIYDLQGSLVLKKVIITPTSITSYGDNYLYKTGGKDCLKANEISLAFGNDNYNIINEDVFIVKNEKNEFYVDNEIVIGCNTKSSIGFLINTYFKNYNSEWTTSVSNYTYFNILNPQKNSDLKNGQIEYSLYGINSETRSFSFDISIIFDFLPEN